MYCVCLIYYSKSSHNVSGNTNVHWENSAMGEVYLTKVKIPWKKSVIARAHWEYWIQKVHFVYLGEYWVGIPSTNLSNLFSDLSWWHHHSYEAPIWKCTKNCLFSQTNWLFFWSDPKSFQKTFHMWECAMRGCAMRGCAMWGHTMRTCEDLLYVPLGPVTPLPIWLYIWPDDLYTILIENPKL